MLSIVFHDALESSRSVTSSSNNSVRLTEAGRGKVCTGLVTSWSSPASTNCSLITLRHVVNSDLGCCDSSRNHFRNCSAASFLPGSCIQDSWWSSQPAFTRNLADSNCPCHVNQHNGELCWGRLQGMIEINPY